MNLKKILIGIFSFLLICSNVSAKWLGFKAYLRSNRLEQALTNNALIMSGFYPHKNTVNKTYTTLESVDSITRGAFDDELLVELTPGFHRISCRYQRPSPFRKSVGTLVSVTYNFEKGKIYIPCGKLLGSKWLLEIKEYTSPENMNKKSISRIKKGFKKYWKKNQKSMSKQVKNPDTPHLMNGKFNL